MSSADEIMRRQLANLNRDDFEPDSATAIEPMALKMVSIPAHELERLKEKNRRQASQITFMRESLEQKNRDLDAMSFVWCDGACTRGVHRYSDTILTEEMVQRVERNTKRLRQWYNGIRWKLNHYPVMSEWHRRHAESAAARTDLKKDE